MAGPRVLYVIDSLAPGGAERSLVEVAPHLIDRGIQLEVAVLHERVGFSKDLIAAGVPVTLLEGHTRARWLQDLRGLIKRRQPDVVHTTLYDADQVGRIAAALTRTPVMSSLVNSTWGVEHMTEPNLSRLRVELARIVDLVTARHVRLFHAVSDTVADDMSSRLHVPRTRIEVIGRGRDADRLGRRSPERTIISRTSLSIADDEILLVSLARHEPQKRLDVLVRAMSAVRRVLPSARLLVAGREGRDTSRLRRLIADLGLEAVVGLLGTVDGVPDLLCAADLFILPTMREGMPGSIIEALALEVPIVASDIPAVRGMVDESMAFLVPVGGPAELARSVIAALADSSGCRSRTKAGRTRFESQFTIEASADQWARLYRSVSDL